MRNWLKNFLFGYDIEERMNYLKIKVNALEEGIDRLYKERDKILTELSDLTESQNNFLVEKEIMNLVSEQIDESDLPSLVGEAVDRELDAAVKAYIEDDVDFEKLTEDALEMLDFTDYVDATAIVESVTQEIIYKLQS